jgi:hypothetical protein
VLFDFKVMSERAKRMISSLLLSVSMVLTTMILFVAALVVNEVVLPASEFARGINWIYLPAGVRLISVLLFSEAGAIGLLLASWLVNYVYFFPGNFERAFMGGILATAAPYVVYRLATLQFGLAASLSNLTPRRLFLCIAACSLTNAMLQHAWLISSGRETDVLPGLFAMAIGDFTGTLLIVYCAKFVLALLASRRGSIDRS